jgi:hypothetical protein
MRYALAATPANPLTDRHPTPMTAGKNRNVAARHGINVDDEPVPPIVHQMMRSFVLGSQQYDRDRENDTVSLARDYRI